MAGAEQNCVYRITERTFEPVPIELVVRLNVTDARSIALRLRIIARRPRVIPRRNPGE